MSSSNLITPKEIYYYNEVLGLVRNFLMSCDKGPHIDYGCGQGSLTYLHASRPPYPITVGYDSNTSKISHAKDFLTKHPLANLEFTTSLEDINKKFGSASMNFVYHEKPEALIDVRDLLTPSGKIAIIDYNMKGVSLRRFKKFFCLDNEKRVLRDEGLEFCFEKHTTYGIGDCISQTETSGFRIKNRYSSDKYFALVCEKVS